MIPEGRRTAGSVLRWPALACALSLCLLAVPAYGAFGATTQLWSVDLVELACAALAALGCGVRARRSVGRLRKGWAWLSGACASWAAGQALWSVYELLLAHEAPFPSPADGGFLGFSVAAVVALWLLPSTSSVERSARRLLDGLLVACSIAVISWATALGAVFHAGGSTVELLVSVAYPAGDVVVLTMAVIAVTQGSRNREALALVIAGLVAMAIADSRFAYTSAVGSYETGAVDLGWCAAFLLVLLSSLLPSHPDAGEDRPRQSRLARLLPYLTLVTAGAVVLARYVRGEEFDQTLVVLLTVLVGLVLLRQWTGVRENQHLVDVIAEREEQLRHQAFHDSLTGLANRDLFAERILRTLEKCEQEPRAVTVAFLDLDGFKAINDTLGHAAGDELLIGVAERLRGVLRSTDSLARLSGDEFGVLLDACTGQEAVGVATSLLATLHSPFHLRNKDVSLSASIGLASYVPGQEVPTADLMLRRADVAMYDVKRHGKNGVREHTPEMRLEEADDLELQHDLARAIANREVVAHFQPILDLTSDLVTGLEALARWERDGTQIPPAVFVRVAERTGQSAALTDLMLDQACAQLAQWCRRPGGSDVVVGVNISPAELLDHGLPGRVMSLVEKHGVDARQLLLEITETGVLRDIDRARAVMTALQDRGVSFAMDDFGVGYSSLSQLLSIPLDSVKVDRVFVERIDHDREAQRFLEGVLAFTSHVGLRVVAEGIERESQLDQLRAMGCTWVQGYHVGRPVAAADLAPLPPAVTFLPR